MDAIAAKGMAQAKIDNFHFVMHKMGNVRRMAELFCLRRRIN
ncbi:hypothetical protein V7128_17645 [Neobacillus vireti]